MSENILEQSYLKDNLKWLRDTEGNFWITEEKVAVILSVVK